MLIDRIIIANTTGIIIYTVLIFLMENRKHINKVARATNDVIINENINEVENCRNNKSMNILSPFDNLIAWIINVYINGAPILVGIT